MKHLVIGQLQKPAKFSAFHWSTSRSQAFIGQLLGTSRVVHLPKRTVIVLFSGEPGLVDRVLALHAGSRGFNSHRGHIPERFFRSNRPGYPHPVSSELENSVIRVAVGDCSVTERRRWRPPYQTGKTVHMHAKHNEGRRTAPGVCSNGSVPLSHSGNVVTRIGIHTHTMVLFTISDA